MISIGIIGGSGYTGKKLIEFCNAHEYVSSFDIYAKTTACKSLYSVFPELENVVENKIINDTESISFEHDLYFLALPHGEAIKYVTAIIAAGKKVIDLGGDFRLNSNEDYKKWYHFEHENENLLEEKIYGLADYYNNYEDAQLVSNPGCYPTAALLSLLPLAENFGSEILSTSVVSYSGTSGAGKSANPDLLMSEMFGNARAYNVNVHRHEPEIFQQLNKVGFDSPFSFTTHLLPIAVGIYSTASVHLKLEISAEEIKNAYSSAYANSSFVRLRNVSPELKWVVGTNFCDINISVKNKLVIITAAIDNLIKGASGQAIQNMNKLFGWNETEGIINKGVKNVPVY
ncbi:MAG: N-acetyl-gamma-glutamyl-phosphate reductase [bacterium]